MKNNIIPANPPKKEKSINIIYHDENYKIFKTSINADSKRFEEASNGSFIYSNSLETLEAIMKEIYIKNNINITNRFLLITTGSTFEKVISFLKQNQYINLIDKACIYCMRKEKYLPLMEKYKILGGVFHIPSNVVEFIENNLSEDNTIFEYSKFVLYDNYVSNFHILHQIISKYYSNSFQNSMNIAIDILKDILDKDSNDNKRLIETIEKFTSNDYAIIKEYTKNFYSYINKWLLKNDKLVYEKAGYFIGGLMYKLNVYGINKKKGMMQKSILYRGIYLDYLDALSYKKYKDNIISFQTFLSTSPKVGTAEFFSRLKRSSVQERQKECKFSSILKIEYNWDEGLFPLCFDISDISYYKNEEEYLFHPFSFFKIKDFKIDLINHTLNLDLQTIGKKEILEEQIKLGKKIILNEPKKIMEVNN